MPKNLNLAKSVFAALAVFVAPLLFFTDFSRNPFAVQSSLLALACAGAAVLWTAGIITSGKVSIKVCLPDIFFAGFLLTVCAGVLFNYSVAFADGFINRGSVLFTNGVFAYILARTQSDAKFKGKPWALSLWSLLWLVWPVFSGGYIYEVIVWCVGLHICRKELRELGLTSFLNVFISVAFIASCYGLLQCFGLDLFWKDGALSAFGSRAVSTFGNPNFLSSYIIAVLPAALVFFTRADKTGDKIFYFSVLCVFAAYLAVSQTRSSWAGLLAGCAVLLCSRSFRASAAKRKKRILLLCALATLLFALWPSGQKDYKSAVVSRARQSVSLTHASAVSFSAPQEKTDPALRQRLMMWSCGLQAFKESPLLGKGWGGFELNFALCQGGLIKDYPNLALLITRANGAHNIFIETLAQSGAVGFLFFILFFISFFAAALANTRKACGEDKLFPLALLACAVAMLVDNLLNITVQTNITAFVFWWLVSSLLWRGARNFEIKIPVAAGAALFASVFIGAVFLVVRQKNYLLALNMEHRAGKYYAARNYGQASSLSAKSLKRFKYNPYAWELLLNSLFKRAEYGKALEASRQAVKYYPDYYEFLFKKGALEAALGEAPSAARDLQAALALNPAKASDSELKKISLFAQNQIPLYNKP